MDWIGCKWGLGWSCFPLPPQTPLGQVQLIGSTSSPAGRLASHPDTSGSHQGRGTLGLWSPTSKYCFCFRQQAHREQTCVLIDNTRRGGIWCISDAADINQKQSTELDLHQYIAFVIECLKRGNRCARIFQARYKYCTKCRLLCTLLLRYTPHPSQRVHTPQN